MRRSPQVPGRVPAVTWDFDIIEFTLNCLHVQFMHTQASQEISELKEELKVEKGKRETSKKLSSDFQESLLNVTDSLEKAKKSFADDKEMLTRRAEEAEAKLGPVTQELIILKG